MKRFTIFMALMSVGYFCFGQSADDDAIKKAIQAELDATMSHNLDAWKTTRMQNDGAHNTFSSRNGGYYTVKGWDSVVAVMARQFKEYPQPDSTQVKNENFSIQSNGNMAIVNYDMIITPPNADSLLFPYTSKYLFHNSSVLLKVNEQWKVLSRIAILSDEASLSETQQIETDLNAAGYKLVGAKKLTQAIELFKLNVKLYPNSHNTYDSLAEAYAMAGNKKLAIENYEKSLKLNPKSESAPQALVKLKRK